MKKSPKLLRFYRSYLTIIQTSPSFKVPEGCMAYSCLSDKKLPFVESGDRLWVKNSTCNEDSFSNT